MNLNHIKLITFVLLTLVFTSCSNKTNSSNNTQAEEIISVDSILSNGENLIGKTISIEGFCTHTCRHGARKMFLMGSDNSLILRVEAGKDWERGFSGNCIKNIVKVIGTVHETRIDEAYLQKWETQIAQQKSSTTTDENEKQHCSTDSQACQEQGTTVEEKIANYRQRIAQRKETEGKEYLSFYFFEADSYEVIDSE